jgi:hypothetical protein
MTETNDTPNVMTFGKHKGRTIEELLIADPQYLQWLCNQDWFRAKFVVLHQTIINRGAEPEETPEHNSMQVKFLDDDYCVRFLNHFKSSEKRRDELENERQGKLRHAESCLSSDSYIHYDKKSYLKDQKIYEVPISDIDLQIYRKFEDRGVDVRLNFYISSKSHSKNYLQIIYGYNIELKPIVGDDYPNVLRQMKRLGCTVLIVSSYTGTGATREQFIKTMKTEDIKVMFASELEKGV